MPMGENFMLSLEKELGYEGIVTKMEEMWRRQLLQRRLDWFVGREQGVSIYGLSYFIYLKT
jgi:hypothetical protein